MLFIDVFLRPLCPSLSSNLEEKQGKPQHKSLYVLLVDVFCVQLRVVFAAERFRDRVLPSRASPLELLPKHAYPTVVQFAQGAKETVLLSFSDNKSVRS